MSKYSRSVLISFLLVVLALSMVVGCAQPAPAPSPSPTAKPAPAPTPSPKTTPTPEPLQLVAASRLEDANTQESVSFKQFAKEVEARSNGRIKIKVVTGGALLADKDLVGGVQKGVADFGARTLDTWPLNGVLEQPGEVELGSMQTTRGVVYLEWKLFREFPVFQQEYAKNDLVFLFGVPSPPYAFALKKPAKTFADLKGLKVRMVSEAVAKTFAGSGMIPVYFPSADEYTNIATGVADGTYSVLSGRIDKKVHEVAPHFMAPSPTGGSMALFSPAAHFMSLKTWNRISAEDRRILQEAAHAVAPVMADMMQKEYENGVAFLKSNPKTSMTFWSDEETAKWVAAVKAAQGDYWAGKAADWNKLGLPGTELVTKLKQLVKDFSTGKWDAKSEYLAAKQ